jgi:threonine aldolase
MRFVSAQLNALFEDDARIAIHNARHANAMAQRLYDGVVAIAKKNKDVKIPNRAEANAVFPILRPKITARLQKDYRFYVWNQATGQVRWMCAWDTTPADVDGLLEALKKSLK